VKYSGPKKSNAAQINDIKNKQHMGLGDVSSVVFSSLANDLCHYGKK